MIKVLDWPPVYPSEYVGCELGAKIILMFRMTIGLSLDLTRLKFQDLLGGFIKKRVLYPENENLASRILVLAK